MPATGSLPGFINRTGTHDVSDDSGSSIPSVEAVHIDDNRSTQGPKTVGNVESQTTKYDDVNPNVEGRVHEKVYETNQSSGEKLRNNLLLFVDRFGERCGILWDRLGEQWKENRRCVVGGIAAFVLLLVILTAMTVNVVKDKKSLQPSTESTSEEGNFDFTYVEDDTKPPTSRIPYEPTIQITQTPSTTPTAKPTITSIPSLFPSKYPSFAPSISPTDSPTVSSAPTNSLVPTKVASTTPTYAPTVVVDPVPKQPITQFSASERLDSVLTFCVIADVPYTVEEVEALPNQIETQMEGCEFLVHLGDIFVGDTFCLVEDYETIHDIMLESNAPAFLVPGDNEWNDCWKSEIDVGWEHWTNHFIGFENNWNHTYSIFRQPGYDENFYFIEKRTLVFGLNIVGGRVHNETEWTTRLRSEYKWVRDIMLVNLLGLQSADGVILMAHANPSEDHHEFFNAFRVFLRDELKNEFPVLYLHGDGHNFLYTQHYHNQSNFLRIQHEGGTNEPVLKIMAGPKREAGGRSLAHNAFQFDRQLNVFPSTPKSENTKSDNKQKEKK